MKQKIEFQALYLILFRIVYHTHLSMAKKEYVARAFRLAYTLGYKGITIYRDRSRNEQVLTTVEDLLQDCEYCGAVLNPT